MAKRSNRKTFPAAESGITAPADVTLAPEAVDPAQAPSAGPDGADAAADGTPDTAPAAPAASEPAASDTTPAADPETSADPAAPPESPQAAPPAPAEGSAPTEGSAPDAHEPLPGSIDLSSQTDQSQEILDGLAEVKQPEVPRLDRVLSRLARTMAEPMGGKYQSPSPEVRLHGEAIELNARLFEAMAAEGVAASRQGDTLQFLLEELGASLRQGF